MFKKLVLQVRFVYRNTVRSGSWSIKALVCAVQTAVEIY